MLSDICMLILSVHFGRIVVGNLYRASPPLYMAEEQLSRMLQKDKVGPSDRVKLFLHSIFAS